MVHTLEEPLKLFCASKYSAIFRHSPTLKHQINQRSMNSHCPFCTLPDDRVIAQCELTQTLRDGFPISPGHTLIIPRRHFGTYFQATQEELQAISEAINSAKILLDDEFEPDGYNMGVNNGAAAGQTVFHLHVHLIPRYDGDIEDPRGGVRWIFPEKADYWSNR